MILSGGQWATLSVSSAFIAAAIWLWATRRGTKHSSLPPRIPGLPLLGNALQLANLGPLQLNAWKNKHGPIYTLSAMGQLVVVVSDAATASAILDKMSAVTSSRPHYIMLDLMVNDNIFVMQPYNEKWRRYRRGAHEILRIPNDFYPVQENEARVLVCDLATGVDTLEGNLRRLAASTIWRTMYGGLTLKVSGEKNLQQLHKIVEQLLSIFSPGGSVVDLIPILNLLPTSLAPFKRYSQKFFASTNTFFLGLAEDAITRKLSFNDPTKLNLCAMLAEQREEQNLTNEDIAWICGAIFIAGAETTARSLNYFILAMVLHPDVQRKAREELDSEVGDRPPTFADRDRLPYIEAIVKEVLRWRPVAAMGAPHVVTEDFAYEKFAIPKGTILLSNLWSITHDPELFDDPDEFKPERFLGSEESSCPKNVRDMGTVAAFVSGAKSPRARCSSRSQCFSGHSRSIRRLTRMAKGSTLHWTLQAPKELFAPNHSLTS